MKKVFFVLSWLILAGCSRGDPELQLSLYEIKSLCGQYARAAPEKIAECELEYRIKQQEANKPF